MQKITFYIAFCGILHPMIAQSEKLCICLSTFQTTRLDLFQKFGMSVKQSPRTLWIDNIINSESGTTLQQTL